MDPKSVELAGYAGRPDLLAPIVTTPAAAADLVGRLAQEVARREALFAGKAKDLRWATMPGRQSLCRVCSWSLTRW